MISLKVEYALAILQFYEYAKSKKLIVEAMSNYGMEISFTGKLGVRTKYQKFQVPQLVVEIERSNQFSIEGEFDKETQNINESAPVVAKLDEIEDNILYETPILTSVLEAKPDSNAELSGKNSDYYSFIDVEGVQKISKEKSENPSKKSPISLPESICILALIKQLIKSRPVDDMLRKQLTAYIEKSLEKYCSWSVLLNQLLIRSDLEFRHNKKLDRAMVQYEAIMEDSSSKKGSPRDRLRFLQTIQYPSFLEISTKFAKNYMRLNAYMSASIVFEEVELWEQAVQCKVIGGNPDQAMKLLKKLTPEQQTTPQMLCVLGDIKKDPSFYTEAWEKSECRLARAQRSLAKYHFYRKEFELAIPAFEKALKLNRLDINSLSNLGYMHMAMGNVEKAIDCYSSIISIDENQSMAWANLSLLYRNQGKIREAFKTCLTASGKNERNHQMLMNLQTISFDCQEFSEFIRSTLKIIQLNKAQVLEEVVFKKLNYVMGLLFESCKNEPKHIRSTEINFQKIGKIYLIMVKKFPLKDFLWIHLNRFMDLEIKLLKLKRKQKMKMEKESKKAFFFTPLTDYQKQNAELICKKFKIMQKRIHAKMNIGWQDILEKCEEVLKLVIEHQEFFKVNIGCFEKEERKKYGTNKPSL